MILAEIYAIQPDRPPAKTAVGTWACVRNRIITIATTQAACAAAYAV